MKSLPARFVMILMPQSTALSLRRHRRRLGFSLTELLVVIAIAAILVAIIFVIGSAAIKAVRALRG